MPRIKMKLALAPQTYDRAWPCRTISRSDGARLAALLLEAYRGTIDDGGETLGDAEAELRATFDGIYGTFKRAFSFVVEDETQALGASIITWWKGAPLLVFLMVHPTAKNGGMGTFLLQRSIEALREAGHTELWLFVTEGNANAQHIYEKMGFEAVETLPDDA